MASWASEDDSAGTPAADMANDMLVVVHFTLVFRGALDLKDADLLGEAVEAAVRAGTGAVFDALVSFFSAGKRERAKLGDRLRMLPPEERVREMRALCERGADDPRVRDIVCVGGRVAQGVRLGVGARDGGGVGYVWVRGGEGCFSGRVVEQVQGGRCWAHEELSELAVALEGRRLYGKGKRMADRAAAAWVRERAARANARAEKVEKAVRAAAAKRSRATDRLKFAGSVVDLEMCGRGRRARKPVSYEEPVVAAEDEDFDEDEDESDVDQVEDTGEEFVIESDEEEAEDEREELGENAGSELSAEEKKENMMAMQADGPLKLGHRRVRTTRQAESARLADPEFIKRRKIDDAIDNDIEPDAADFAM